ncbi:MAG: chemotaxis protein CheW [Pseudomonadota bacterium]
MEQEQLFASFLLDKELGLEIALNADYVVEATVKNAIKPLPSGASFLEGLMHLREDVIPVINLKKRFGFHQTGYAADSKVAVIDLGKGRFGLLVDDIKDVLRVPVSKVEKLDSVMLSEDRTISDIIKLDNGSRVLELLNLEQLFGEDKSYVEKFSGTQAERSDAPTTKIYSRYVVFSSCGQEYGISVDDSREIAFVSEIDDIFKNGIIQGSLQIRGRTIAVLNGSYLFGRPEEEPGEPGPADRILVLQNQDFTFGIIVDQIKEIITIADDVILPMPSKENRQVKGVCQFEGNRNIILLDVNSLIDAQKANIDSMAQLDGSEHEDSLPAACQSRHIITENCYLIFSIGRNFAIELKDVQEIIENERLLPIPEATGISEAIINLRGRVVPVINLRKFYNYAPRSNVTDRGKLIIGKSGAQLVAMQVDDIVTIYKQEQFYPPPISINAGLEPRRDTLDRVIEFLGNNNKESHVFVVNVKNILKNHLDIEVREQVDSIADNLSCLREDVGDTAVEI